MMLTFTNIDNIKDGNLGYYEFKKGKIIIEKFEGWTCYFRIEHSNYDINEVWKQSIYFINNEPYINTRLGKILLKDIILKDGTNLSFKVGRTEYKEFNKINIGSSDIATLIMAGCPTEESSELITKPLYFGEDGNYNAYYINEGDIEIPKHYKKVQEFSHWLKIYDDNGLSFKVNGDKIEVFRCGDFGCIIKTLNN